MVWFSQPQRFRWRRLFGKESADKEAVISRDQEPDSLLCAKDQIPKSQYSDCIQNLRTHVETLFYQIYKDMDSQNELRTNVKQRKLKLL